MESVERSASAGTTRFGYNTMLKDNEFKGEGNSYTTEFRFFDPRVGRWWSLDPVEHEWESPYAGFGNNPVLWSDPRGNDIFGDAWDFLFGSSGESATPLTPGKEASEGIFTQFAKGFREFFSNSSSENAAWVGFMRAFGQSMSAENEPVDIPPEAYIGKWIPDSYKEYTRITFNTFSSAFIEVNSYLPTSFMTDIPMAYGMYESLGYGQEEGIYGLALTPLAFTPHKSVIRQYKAARKLTKGFNHLLEAHKLVEARHLRALGLEHLIPKTPSIILQRAEHVELTNQLFKALPKLGPKQSYTKQQILDAYKEVYKDYPELYEVAKEFLLNH